MTVFVLNVTFLLMSSNPFDVLFPYLLTGQVGVLAFLCVVQLPFQRVFCSDCGFQLHPAGQQLVGADLVLFPSLGKLGSGRDLKQSHDITRITVNCLLNFTWCSCSGSHLRAQLSFFISKSVPVKLCVFVLYCIEMIALMKSVQTDINIFYYTQNHF